MTEQLLQKIYAELDPHKKTYLSLKDWISSFQVFNKNAQLMIEVKNFMQTQFANLNSAFGFFQSFAQKEEVNQEAFNAAINSLIRSRKLTKADLKYLYQTICHEKQAFDLTDFSKEFSNIKFGGKQLIPLFNEMNRKKAVMGNVDESKWEKELITKLKKLIRLSGKSIDQIFGQFDVDGGGDISYEEFYKAMKEISATLTTTEINKIMQRVDADRDGSISY